MGENFHSLPLNYSLSADLVFRFFSGLGSSVSTTRRSTQTTGLDLGASGFLGAERTIFIYITSLY